MGNDRKDWVVLGQVARPHGVRGALRVHWYSDPTVLTGPPECLRLRLPTGQEATFAVTELRATTDVRALVTLDGLADVDAAAKWRSAQISVPRALVPPAGDDEIYLFELLGRQIYAEDGARLGRAANLYDYGAGPILGIDPDAPVADVSVADLPAPVAAPAPAAAPDLTAQLPRARRGRRSRQVRAAELLVPLLPGTLRRAEVGEDTAVLALDASLLPST